MQSTTIAGIHTIGIRVGDQSAALAFYTERLGFETRIDAAPEGAPEGAARWIEVAPPGSPTNLALIGDETPAVQGETGIRFTVPDAAAEHTAMREHGVDVGELLRWEGVPPMYAFTDPDGNGFEVIETPSW